MLPALEREVVEKRKWITQAQLYDYYAIGQSTPGIIAVNVATFTGYTRARLVGACAATAGIVFPSLIIIMIIATFFENFSHIVWVQKALAGINVSVAVLVSFTLAKMVKKTCVDALTTIITVAAFALMLALNVQGVFIVIFSSIIGIAAQYKKIKAKSLDEGTAPSKGGDGEGGEN